METALDINHLYYRYPKSDVDTLVNLNVAIEKGEIFGFLGPSGAGKSTTQKILYKLLEDYRGEILFEGKNLKQWDRSFYEKIGVGFELPNHYLKLTALENLQFFSSFYPNATKDVMGLLEKIGLEKDANKQVSEFSKGMKMRLNFIRAILHNPDFLFLDEPTSGLDPINAKTIKDWILALKAAGKTIFITTHSMADADQLCDRVALLHQGEIQALDTPRNIKLNYGERRLVVVPKSTATPLHFDLDNIGNNQQFAQLVATNDIETIHSEEATLEDAFIKITGNKLL